MKRIKEIFLSHRYKMVSNKYLILSFFATLPIFYLILGPHGEIEINVIICINIFFTILLATFAFMSSVYYERYVKEKIKEDKCNAVDVCEKCHTAHALPDIGKYLEACLNCGSTPLVPETIESE